ncbi:PTS mannose/fructose/sorbose transporter subunit IIC [Streptococcus pseudopneumoniae]|uniref:PTS mannose/fructose/sorbose transporter subunit IIC n=1 Tax=Streptococcus pseudopneumoniae TaxID=257758 RepID=UPI00066EAA83|nr:PTS mannose/fructose/sorbose transporter subunit IIC [Streptococcus pseudopneumoniae]
MSIISMVLVVAVAFLAGLEGILDQFQFHQPIVACTLIGLVTGNLEAGIILGGSLQMIALGWANIGAAVAPDAALASVAAAIIMVLGGDFTKTGIGVAQAVAIPLAVAGLFLTMIVRTLSVGLVHTADAAAKKGDFKAVERAHFIALLLQGLRIAVPAALLLMVPTETVQSILNAMPDWLKDGMAIGGGMVVAVGYAMVINMMATREVWPFFAIGFVLAAVSDITLIGFGAIGVAIALIYLHLSKTGGNSGGGAATSNDPIGDILEDY